MGYNIESERIVDSLEGIELICPVIVTDYPS